MFNAPAEQVPLEFSNSGIALKKTKSPAATSRWKKFDNMCVRFDTILDSDGHTDGRICHNNIALCMHWRADA